MPMRFRKKQKENGKIVRQDSTFWPKMWSLLIRSPKSGSISPIPLSWNNSSTVQSVKQPGESSVWGQTWDFRVIITHALLGIEMHLLMQKKGQRDMTSWLVPGGIMQEYANKTLDQKCQRTRKDPCNLDPRDKLNDVRHYFMYKI